MDTYEYQLQPSDMRRLMQAGKSGILKRMRFGSWFLVGNIAAWAAFAFGFAAVFNHFGAASISRLHLFMIIAPFVCGVLLAAAVVITRAREWERALLEGAGWILEKQSITMHEDKVVLQSESMNVCYRWSIFKTFYEDDSGIILGGGSEPVFFVPTDGRLSDACLAWIRNKFQA